MNDQMSLSQHLCLSLQPLPLLFRLLATRPLSPTGCHFCQMVHDSLTPHLLSCPVPSEIQATRLAPPLNPGAYFLTISPV